MKCDKNTLKNCQYELLEYVKKVCIENKLRYFLVGGTLLGAVRHKDFIPWDDDIDIALPRDDYNRLANYLEKNIDEKFFYQSRQTDKEYPFAYAKLRYNNTLFLQKSLKNLEMHHGIFIDIFPLDGVSDNPKKQKKYFKKIRTYNYMIISYYLRKSNYFLFNKFVTFIMSIFYIFLGKKRIRDRLDKIATKYEVNDSKYVVNYFGAWGMREIIDKEYIFGENKEVFFHNDFFSSPTNYDKYLSHIYGNYMELPPVDKRVSDHNVEDIQVFFEDK